MKAIAITSNEAVFISAPTVCPPAHGYVRRRRRAASLSVAEGRRDTGWEKRKGSLAFPNEKSRGASKEDIFAGRSVRHSNGVAKGIFPCVTQSAAIIRRTMRRVANKIQAGVASPTKGILKIRKGFPRAATMRTA